MRPRRYFLATFAAFALVQPRASACPLLIAQSIELPVAEFIVCAGEKRTEPTAQPLNVLSFGHGGINFHAEISSTARDDAGVTGEFGRSDGALHFDQLRRQSIENDPALSTHDIAAAIYHAINGMNGTVATELLNSYRTLGRVRDDIMALIKVPLNSVGLSNDLVVSQAGPASTTLADNGDRVDDSVRWSDIDRIMALIHFLLSVEMLPYYIFGSSIYLLFIFSRMALRAKR